MTEKEFINKLKTQKRRATPAREKMFKMIQSSVSPIEAEKLVKKIGVNKTTIYRDLDLFATIGIIQEADFGDGIKRYELKDLEHHHHLVCLKCKKVQGIIFNESLEWEESRIKKNQKFQVLRHDLEFFGYCQNCIQ
jgi:Fur family ferric uptake transcriptional regulator